MSFIYDLDLDFSNNYVLPKYEWMTTEIDHYNFRDRVSPVTGKPINVFTIGPAFLWAPFYGMAQLGGEFYRQVFNADLDLAPFGRYSQYTVMYSAIIYTVISLLLLFKLLNALFSTFASMTSVWLILVTSPLYYYAVFEPSMSHVYDLFTFTLFLFLFWKCISNSSTLNCSMLGAVGALCILVRTQNMITIGLFSILLLFYLRNHQRISGKSVVLRFSAYLLFLAAGLLITLMINTYLYGSPFTVPQGQSFLHPFSPKVLQLLFSLRNGMFSHHPLLLAGGVGFVIFLIKLPKNPQKVFFVTLLLTLIVQIYVNSIADDWWAGHSFGQRRMISSLPIIAYGFAYLIEEASHHVKVNSRKLILIGVALVSVLNFYLVLIHVFLWNYDQPHNILIWMFYDAPIRIFKPLSEQLPRLFT